MQAHLNACLLHLCRAFDQNQSALHLKSWLLTIKDNLALFDEPKFCERLKDNQFVDTLAKDPRRPDVATLDRDIESCSIEDPLVRNLNTYRGSLIAHKSARNVVNQKNIGDQHPLKYDDIETLLKRSDEILNRYSGLFSAHFYSTSIVGREDYRYIVECVEKAVEQVRSQGVSQNTSR